MLISIFLICISCRRSWVQSSVSPPNDCSLGIYISWLHCEAETFSKDTSNRRCAIVSGDLLIKSPCPQRCCFHSPKASLSTQLNKYFISQVSGDLSDRQIHNIRVHFSDHEQQEPNISTEWVFPKTKLQWISLSEHVSFSGHRLKEKGKIWNGDKDQIQGFSDPLKLKAAGRPLTKVILNDSMVAVYQHHPRCWVWVQWK